VWPQSKRLATLSIVGILAVISLENAIRISDSSALAGVLNGVPWRWVLTSIIGTVFLVTLAFQITSRRKRQTVTTPCPEQWTHSIADYEIRRTRKFVLVETCLINASYLPQGELYLDFTFSILNLSIFVVSIPMTNGSIIENPIFFKGKMLSREAKLAENDVKNVYPAEGRSFTIRQWVNSDEAKDIIQTLAERGNLFDFSRPVIYVTTQEFPDAKYAELDLTRGMKNAALENKLVELGNDNIWLRRGLTLWEERTGPIEELTRTLGIFYLASFQLDKGEMLSEATASTLRSRFMLALSDSFHDHKLEDKYSDNLPPLPDSIPKQKQWIDEQCSELRKLITAQKVGLSEYFQKTSGS
jgi:hypothetical protein